MSDLLSFNTVRLGKAEHRARKIADEVASHMGVGTSDLYIRDIVEMFLRGERQEQERLARRNRRLRNNPC